MSFFAVLSSDQRIAGMAVASPRSLWSDFRRCWAPFGGCQVDVLLARGVLHYGSISLATFRADD